MSLPFNPTDLGAKFPGSGDFQIPWLLLIDQGEVAPPQWGLALRNHCALLSGAGADGWGRLSWGLASGSQWQQ